MAPPSRSASTFREPKFRFRKRSRYKRVSRFQRNAFWSFQALLFHLPPPFPDIYINIGRKSAAGLLTNTAKAGTEWVSVGFGTVGNIAKGTGKFVVDVASDAIGEIPMVGLYFLFFERRGRWGMVAG